MINVLGDALAAGIIAHLCRKDFPLSREGKVKKQEFVRPTNFLLRNLVFKWMPCDFVSFNMYFPVRTIDGEQKSFSLTFSSTLQLWAVLHQARGFHQITAECVQIGPTTQQIRAQTLLSLCQAPPPLWACCRVENDINNQQTHMLIQPVDEPLKHRAADSSLSVNTRTCC